MYIPRKFGIADDAIAEALTSAELAYLISNSAEGMAVTPLPMMYDSDRHALVGHIARANPHWRDVDPDVESVAIVRPAVDGYISPGLYATKTEHGKVVPTWNYEIVCVYGTLAIHDDPDWLLEHVTSLSKHHEKSQPQPWKVSDAPDDFIAGQLKAIVGVELPISRWEGKAKMSQNQPEDNQRSVVDGLTASNNHRDREIADRVLHYTAT